MEAKINTAPKNALVQLVKYCQKRDLKGTKGNWRDFLISYDKQIGDSIKDPSKKTHDVLATFLKTFDNKGDLKFFDKVLQCYSNRNMLDQFKRKSSDGESPEERLVRLTFEHPQYPIEYSFSSYDEDWLVTKPYNKSKKKKLNAIIAIDCEMVLCDDGTEAVVRVCAVDRNLEVKLNEFVKPNKAIVDYRTNITGITQKDLVNATCSLPDIQKSMEKILSPGTILAGHGLNNDLQALKMDHTLVIDTSLIYKYDGPMNKRPSLNYLCKDVLGYELRKHGAVHNCVDDARAAMKLVLAMMESGVNSTFTLVGQVPENEMSKLLFHRIPISVPHEELSRAITGNFKIQPSMKKSNRGDKYSVFALFDNSNEADQAFENLEGSQEEDSCGRPQKHVTFRLSSGIASSLYVRKMTPDNSLSHPPPKKRSLQVSENLAESKKMKANKEIEAETVEKENTKEVSSKNLYEEQSNEIEQLKLALSQSNRQCENHLKEIEELKKKLSQRDFGISNLHNLIDKLSRR